MRERQARDECEIVPVVIRPCRFDKLELGEIQAVQPSGKPVSEHRKADAAWLAVTRELDRVIQRLKRKRRS